MLFSDDMYKVFNLIITRFTQLFKNINHEHNQLIYRYAREDNPFVHVSVFYDICQFVSFAISKNAEIAARKISFRGTKESTNAITAIVNR